MARPAERFLDAVSRLRGTAFSHQSRGGGLDCLGLLAAGYEASIGKFSIDWPHYEPP